MAKNIKKQREQLYNIITDMVNFFSSYGNGDTLGIYNFERLASLAQKLYAANMFMFGENGDKEPSAEDLKDYSKSCKELHEVFDNIKGLSSNTEITNPNMLNMIADYNTEEKRSILKETDQYIITEKKVTNWKLSDNEKALKQQFLAANYEQLKNNDWKPMKNNGFVEFPQSVGKRLVFSGNLDDLASCYAKNKAKFDLKHNQSILAYLKYRIQNQMLMNRLEKKAVSGNLQRRFPFVEKNGDIMLQNVEGKYQYQTTGNGCWSCAYAMLLENHGVSLKQEQIRAFRPDMGMLEAGERDPKTSSGLVKDDMYSPIELGDLTLKVLPGYAMQQAALTMQHENDNDVKTLVKTLREFIAEKLRENGPVALRLGNHFRTIVGIEGDKLILKDSLKLDPDAPDARDKKDISEIVTYGDTCGLTWIHDLKLDKTGKCANPPKGFEAELDYQDGKLAGIGNANDVMNLSGNTYDKTYINGNMLIQETAYVPREVPQAIWKLEQPQVNENDDDFFLLKDDNKEKAVEEPKKTEPAVKPEPKKAESVVKPEPKKAESVVKAEPKKTAPTVKPAQKEKTEPVVKAEPKKSTAKSSDMTTLSNRALIALTEDVEYLCRINNPAKAKKIKNLKEERRVLTARIMYHMTLAEIIEAPNNSIQAKEMAASMMNDKEAASRMADQVKGKEFFKQTVEALKKISEDKPEKHADILNSVFSKFKDSMNGPQKTATQMQTTKAERQLQL